MPKLYFMDHEFEAEWFTRLDEALESGVIPTLHDSSWHWYHYTFFGCRMLRSEESVVLRAYLLDLLTVFLLHRELVLEKLAVDERTLQRICDVLLQIVEASRGTTLSLWIYGEPDGGTFLDEWRAQLPPESQSQFLSDLPHSFRIRRDRHSDDKSALSRYRNELAAFNKSRKR
jgi:hypothetical protein